MTCLRVLERRTAAADLQGVTTGLEPWRFLAAVGAIEVVGAAVHRLRGAAFELDLVVLVLAVLADDRLDQVTDRINGRTLPDADSR